MCCTENLREVVEGDVRQSEGNSGFSSITGNSAVSVFLLLVSNLTWVIDFLTDVTSWWNLVRMIFIYGTLHAVVRRPLLLHRDSFLYSQTCLYSTLAQGLLSGKYDTPEQIPDFLKTTRFYQDKDGSKHGEPGCEREIFDALRRLKALCEKENVSLPQASLAWLYRQKGVSSLLTGPRNPAELHENVKSIGTDISDEFAESMSRLSLEIKERIGDNPDMWNSREKMRTF